jgi:heme a synthase
MKFSMSPSQFQKFAFGALVYNFLVIVWGGFVRASGSGAGCGAHWPLCNGDVLPRAPQMQTLVEFAHRVSSGLCLVVILALWLVARKSFVIGSPVRRYAFSSFILVVLEAAIGAIIVLLKLVGTDASITRGVSMALHLVNTFLLTGALSLTCVFASKDFVSLAKSQFWPTLKPFHKTWPYFFGLLTLIFTGASGAIAALGDTLFPSQPFHVSPQLQAQFQHLFVELRIVHPFVSVTCAAWWLGLCLYLGYKPLNPLQSKFSLLVFVVFCFQIALGFLNVALRAPLWMQMVHLLVADLVVSLSVCLAAFMCFESRNATKNSVPIK